MYAVFVEVDVDESQIADTREGITQNVVPLARAAGAKAGYWLAPKGNRGVAVILFDSEEQARSMAAGATPGESAGAPGTTLRHIEVNEVLVTL